MFDPPSKYVREGIKASGTIYPLSALRATVLYIQCLTMPNGHRSLPPPT